MINLQKERQDLEVLNKGILSVLKSLANKTNDFNNYNLRLQALKLMEKEKKAILKRISLCGGLK